MSSGWLSSQNKKIIIKKLKKPDSYRYQADLSSQETRKRPFQRAGWVSGLLAAYKAESWALSPSLSSSPQSPALPGTEGFASWKTCKSTFCFSMGSFVFKQKRKSRLWEVSGAGGSRKGGGRASQKPAWVDHLPLCTWEALTIPLCWPTGLAVQEALFWTRLSG